MTVDCQKCPLRHLDVFLTATREELAFIEKFKVGELSVEPHAPLLMEGANSPQLFTVLSGMGLRFKTLEDGRRQVVNFVLPGDFLGLQAAIMTEMGHSVEATTSMVLCVFDRSEIFTLIRSNPRLSFAMTWLAAREEHFLAEALTTIGQRDAFTRVAWALTKLYLRCRSLEMTHDLTLPLPFKQQDLADALGLSLVHTNKTLARLRSDRILTWRDGLLKISDLDALVEAAGGDVSIAEKRPLI